jgi:hypothetical protein
MENKDEHEALELANDTLYGLGAGVWTRDMSRAYRMGRGIKAGRVDKLLPPLPGSCGLWLGAIEGCPFYIDREQYERRCKPTFLIDVSPGDGDTFSVEGSEGMHFVARPGEK